MNDFYYNNNEQQDAFVDSVKELQKVYKQLARLNVRREELTDLIIGALEHDHDGQKTYEYGEWKIEIKTPCVYSLDKRKYESGTWELPKEYNPIKQSVSYSIDKRLCDKFLSEAPIDVREALIELIDKKPGKASVIIKERV